MSFEARWPGICTCCGDRFDAGDEVTYDDSALVHEECSVTAQPLRRSGSRVAVQEKRVAAVRVCASCYEEVPLATGVCERC